MAWWYVGAIKTQEKIFVSTANTDTLAVSPCFGQSPAAKGSISGRTEYQHSTADRV